MKKKSWTRWPLPWAAKPSLFPRTGRLWSQPLQRKSFDVIVNGLEPTADRQKQILFSKPYYIFQLALTIRSDEQQIHSLALLEKEQIPMKGDADPVAASEQVLTSPRDPRTKDFVEQAK